MLFSVPQGAKINVRGGKYRFEYAERLKDGTLLIYGEGPVARKNQHRVMVLPSHIQTVHSKTEAVA
jgi:hypothetical protein